MKTYPEKWKARPVDLKSGWMNNAKILSEIVSSLNQEMYIEDEIHMMDVMDHVLEYFKKNYKITDLK